MQYRSKAMTLIEVLVALTIVSFVFSSLTQMTFDALKRTKKLELQDKMRNYATEAVQVVYNAKDKDWAATFGDGGIIPPAIPNAPIVQKIQGKVTYDPTIPPVLQGISYADCHFDPENNVLIGSKCSETSSNEIESNTNKKLFGRLIVRNDDNIKSASENRDTANDVSLEIIVACIENKCSGKDFLPFKLNLDVYRTSAP